MTDGDLRASIRERNKTRADAHLPRLNETAELERLRRVQQETEFENFIGAQQALYRRALRRIEHHYRSRGIRLNFIVGMAIANTLRRAFRRRYEGTRPTRCPHHPENQRDCDSRESNGQG
jgi:hypothetical protein